MHRAKTITGMVFQMRVMVSSRFAVQVVDIETGQVESLPLDYNYPYFGITWNTDHLFLARRWYDRLGADVQVFGTSLNLIDTIMGGHPDMANVHQIQWWDNALFVCCPNRPETERGAVLIYRDGEIRTWYPFEELDMFGVNSIFFEPGKVFLIAHNRGPSYLLKFSYPGLKPTWRCQIGNEAHNVARWKEQLVILDSHGSCARFVEGKSVPLEGYPRGLAISDENIVIGQSYHISDREKRLQDKEGGLIILNHQWERQSYINLNQGHVYDVRFLDVPDYAHHGQPWTGRYGA